MASARRNAPNRFHFGEWVADVDSAELFRNGERVAIQEKPFQVLALLLARPGEIVTRGEIRSTLWRGSQSQADATLNTAVRKLRLALGDSPRQSRIIGTVGSEGYRLLIKPETASSRITSNRPLRIAVTPFRNMSDAQFDYFADSLTEQMIVQLADPQGYIKVIVPVLSPNHREAEQNLRAVAGDVAADYVLAGSMARTGSVVRLNAHLLRASDGVDIWSDRFSRRVTDLFRAQDEITLQLACAILQVVPKRTGLNDDSTALAAYGDTVRGRHFADKWNEPSFLRAVSFFEQAIAEDPHFVRAHAALAKTFASMLQYGVLQPSSNYERLQAEASTALELCPELPEAIVAQGCAQFFYQADWAAAEQSFQHALSVSPGSAYAWESYARLLIATGRHEEAIASAKRSRELSPLSPYSSIILGAAYCYARRFEEGIEPCNECIELEPAFSMARAILGRIFGAMGRLDDAVENYRKALQCAPDSAVMIANLSHGLAVAGRKDEARALLNKLLSMRESGYVPGYWIALCYVGLGEYDRGIEWLSTAVRQRCGWRVLAAVDPMLDVIRDKPEFVEILKHIGFPQAG